MFLISVDPQAMLKTHELEALSRVAPIPHTVDLQLQPSPNREEQEVDINFTTIRALRNVALVSLNLPPSTPTLEAVPLLLEAIHEGLVHYPDIDTAPPSYYYVTPIAYNNLLRYAPERLFAIIESIPIPDEPIIYNPSQPRKSRLDILLPIDTYKHLLALSDLIITSSTTSSRYHVTMDWIGVTQC